MREFSRGGSAKAKVVNLVLYRTEEYVVSNSNQLVMVKTLFGGPGFDVGS